jgi:hypothetical protein
MRKLGGVGDGGAAVEDSGGGLTPPDWSSCRGFQSGRSCKFAPRRSGIAVETSVTYQNSTAVRTGWNAARARPRPTVGARAS